MTGSIEELSFIDEKMSAQVIGVVTRDLVKWFKPVQAEDQQKESLL